MTDTHRHDSTVTSVDPKRLGTDEMNERDEIEGIDDLEDSIEEMGVVQPPLVREADDDSDFDYTVVVGQRRTIAAEHVNTSDERESVGDIPVIVMDWSDEEALKASITENIDLFSQRVAMTDRAQALQQLWEFLGGSEGSVPTNSHLAAELGVPRETVRTWLEPLHGDWKGTTLDPDTDESPSAGVEGLGERKLAEIRRMTEGGEEAEEVAEMVADAGLTQSDLEEMRELVEEEDMAYDDAIDALTDDADEADESPETGLEANVEFGSEMSVAVSEYANENNTEPAMVVVDAVQYFLKAEGYLE